MLFGKGTLSVWQEVTLPVLYPLQVLVHQHLSMAEETEEG